MSKTEKAESKKMVTIERREVIALNPNVTLARVPEGFAVIASCGQYPNPYDLRDMLNQNLAIVALQVEMLQSALVTVGTEILKYEAETGHNFAAAK